MEEINQELLQIGQKVRQVRKAKGLTLSELAKSVDLSTSMISQLENSRMIPTCLTLFKIARALEVSMNFFFEPGKVSVTVQVEQVEKITPKTNSTEEKREATEANPDEAIRRDAKEEGKGVSGVSAVSGVEAT